MTTHKRRIRQQLDDSFFDNSDELNSPFVLQMRCFSLLTEVSRSIQALGECNIDTLPELEAVAKAMESLAFKTRCYITLQTQNLNVNHSV